MCGIVGIAGNLTAGHREAFEDMVRVCQVRGRDSTGVFKVGHNGGVSWAKRVGPPDYLLDTKAYERTIVQGGFPKALVGHCRAKTFGDVSQDNAHPFDFPNVIGVHNGTLRGHHKMEEYMKYDVDSQLLYHHVNEHGIEEVIPKLDNDGAWALVFWDKEKQTLNFLRNDKRPLWFTYSKDLKVMAWASETWMFGPLYRRNGIELWDGGEKQQTYWQLPENELHTFEINGNGKTGPETFKFTSKELKGEVRGHTGNAWTHPGTAGSTNGGSVVRPFPQHREVARQAAETVRRINAGELDDEIPTFGTPPSNVLQLPSLMPKVVAAGTLINTVETSKSTSSKSTDSKMGVISSTRTSKPTLSLHRLNLPYNQRGNNDEFLSELNGTSTISKKLSMVSYRKVIGLQYITDNKTGVEFEEGEFDRITGGHCTYCSSPLGDVSEVNTIFIRQEKARRVVSFTCNSCQQPAVA